MSRPIDVPQTLAQMIEGISMRCNLPGGVWPTMITPFTDGDAPDFRAIEKMVDWYVGKGCSGIFAVCQSSEMFFLSRREKADIAACVRDAAGGRVAVVVSGHTADDPDEQKREIADMAAVGSDAVVLVSNRLARPDEGDGVFMKNIDGIFREFPDVVFGMYECPYPYKRLVPTAFLEECAAGDRGFRFLKDTCCDPRLEKERAAAVRGSSVQLYNANAASLLFSLREGYRGYNGVMANFHPELYVWLCDNHRAFPEEAEKLSAYLTVMAMSEYRCYPVIAKYHFNRCVMPMSLHSRSSDPALFGTNDRLSMDSLVEMEKLVAGTLPCLAET